MTLDDFLAAHADQLRPLLDSLWPVHPCKVEQFGPLTKYTLGPLEDGRWAMLHQLTEPDQGPPHDHPCRFDVTILSGGYREVLYPGGEVERLPGAAFTILPDTIHRIVALLEGESWSLCLAGPVVKKWAHYPGLVK